MPKSKLDGIQAPGTRSVCRVAVFLAQYPEEAEALADMTEDRDGWSAAAIARTVSDVFDFRMPHSSVKRHRRHECRCF